MTREERKQQCYRGSHSVDWVGHADGIMMLFETGDNLEKALQLMNDTFERFNLHINISKTKTMIFNFKYADTAFDEYPHSFVNLNGKAIENVKIFKYLGDQIKYDESSTGEAELDLRIMLAEAKFNEIVKKLTNQHIYLKTRVHILNSLVRSRLTYSCQTWNLTERQGQLVNTVYIKMLRKMIRNGYQRSDDNHYIFTNKNVHDICKTEDITDFVGRQQTSYLAHIVRQHNSTLTKRLLFNDNKYTKHGRRTDTLQDKVLKYNQMTADKFFKAALRREKIGHDHLQGVDRRKLSKR